MDTVEVFMGWQWEARILERFCEYVIDGVPGWGVSEWHYRHYGDRPTKYAELDPQRLKRQQNIEDLGKTTPNKY